MNYETIKSFILVVLVGISFLLSFILWSYQPNYDYFYEDSYVNEVDVGGVERSRNDLFKPKEIVFHNKNKIFSFINPLEREKFYQEIASVVLYDVKVSDVTERPDEQSNEFIEFVFPSAIPAQMITSLFSFEDEVKPPDWSFERVFLTFNKEARTLKLTFISLDERSEITATIEKSETYELLLDYVDGHQLLEEYIAVGSEEDPIYIPKNRVKLSSKTLVAGQINPERFIDALFADPNLVTPNMREAYFTDGQRGMKVVYGGRKLQFINPIQTEDDDLLPEELIDYSITNINEHKGWTNNFLFEEIDDYGHSIKYRLHYDGYPIFDRYSLSEMKQSWKEQVLYEYERPLIIIGDLLNTQEVELPSGEEIISLLEQDNDYELDRVQAIEIGYYLSYIDDNRSLILEPGWFILYGNEWIRYSFLDEDVYFNEGEG